MGWIVSGLSKATLPSFSDVHEDWIYVIDAEKINTRIPSNSPLALAIPTPINLPESK